MSRWENKPSRRRLLEAKRDELLRALPAHKVLAAIKSIERAAQDPMSNRTSYREAQLQWRELEREYWRLHLAAARYSIVRTARSSKTNRTWLYKKLKGLGLHQHVRPYRARLAGLRA